MLPVYSGESAGEGDCRLEAENNLLLGRAGAGRQFSEAGLDLRQSPDTIRGSQMLNYHVCCFSDSTLQYFKACVCGECVHIDRESGVICRLKGHPTCSAPRFLIQVCVSVDLRSLCAQRKSGPSPCKGFLRASGWARGCPYWGLVRGGTHLVWWCIWG